MKRNLILSAFFLLTTVSASFAGEEDSLGLPGDHLDLYATLELFKKSASVEEFEKALNTENNGVNDLDLDGDGKVDYIKVIDNMEDEAHALKLEVNINDKESQSVAVIEMEKKSDKTVNLQIVGDEDLYGKDYIVEPSGDADGVHASMEEMKMGNGDPRTPPIVLVNVWFWPCIQFMYAPVYVIWVSPWHYHYYPAWWSPWGPMPWYAYHKRCYHYHAYHHRAYVYHMNHAHNVYYGHRNTSSTFKSSHPGGGNKMGPGPKVNKGNNGPKPNKVNKQSPNNKNGGMKNPQKPVQKNTAPKNNVQKSPHNAPKPNMGGGGKKGGGGKGRK